MELWIIYSKLILLLFLAVTYSSGKLENLPWIVFSLLLYLGINTLLYIVQKRKLKQFVLLLSIIGIIVSFIYIHPLFLLLLPMNLLELLSPYVQKKWVLLLLVLVPVLYLGDVRYLYGLSAALSLVIFVMTDRYSEKLIRYENQMDKMRHDLQRMTKSLNENKEYIKQSEYTYRLEERNRISQQIHDSIGHSMTGALIQMEASKSLMEQDTEKSKQLLQNAINISKTGIEEIRITLKNMKPPTEQMGVQRMKLMIEEFSVKHRIKAPFVYKGNMEMITPIQWKIISENVTEALTNSMKYGRATEIAVELLVLNRMIKVEVKDNGVGAEKVVKGIGIMGMEERTASVNGTIIVDGKNGFSVTTLLPIG